MLKPITINQKNQGQRLDKFLTEELKPKTRSQIKKMITHGLVLVNDRPTKVHYFLKNQDTISLTTDKKIEKQNTTDYELMTNDYLSPKIIFENKNFAVIDKPAGLLVHPTDKNETNTLVNWLVKQYPKIKNVGENQYRAGIIHRLDKDVSGVMVVPKNNPTYNHLKEQFKQRRVKKQYTALVYGRVSNQADEIDLPIGRNKDGQFVAHPRHGSEKFADKDKIAKTKYWVIEYIRDYTLLKIQILTGRTHQIRAHLTAINHPIIGDQLYRPKKKIFHLFQKKIKVIKAERIFLHSTKIGFKDAKDQWQEFSSPLPKKLTQFLNDQKIK